ncbi:hypothetical protein GEO21_16205 [Sphingobacterium faecium]|uniref:STM3941 family protein n=1 Tax=Sphingobacterium faecium TaxID=34087 RepID=UPI0012911410|nr:STM3941 family protein [Sphingobacterium faecium]MQP29044.1 hypothetical protein [Sphingobacterium faecium]
MNNEIKIYRNSAKTRNLLLSSGAICIVLAVVFMYGLGLFDDVFKAKVAVGTGAVLLIMLILVIKSLINLKDKSAIFELNENSATGKTAPLPRAIGAVAWKDVTAIEKHKIGGDTLVVVYLKNAEFYKNRLSKMYWNMAYDKQSQELQVTYSASEIDMTIDELLDLFLSYWKQSAE